MANEKTRETGQSEKKSGTAGKASSPERRQSSHGQNRSKMRDDAGRSSRTTAASADQPGKESRENRKKSNTVAGKTSEKAAASKVNSRTGSGTQVCRSSESGEQPRTAHRNGTARKEEGDSGYRPYRAENDRKKRKKKNSLQTFFSGKNPILQRITGYVDGVRDRDAMQKMSQKYNPHRTDTPAVIYTQPKAFNRERLLIQLLSIVAVVVALVLALSIFFKVRVITVSGAEVYSPWTIREASGISEGDNLLTFGRAKAAGKIIANCPYVKSARIGIKLPDTVNIEVVEENVVYSIEASDGVWWLINSAGRVMKQTTSTEAKTYTQVLGVTLENPVAGEAGIATEETAAQTPSDESTETTQTVSVSITGLQRLSTALEIMQDLEDNDIVGQIASVDVTRLNDIILWYGTQYQVNLGDNTNLAYKIACMNDVILQLSDYQTGILDVSFTTWKQQVGYTPFE